MTLVTPTRGWSANGLSPSSSHSLVELENISWGLYELLLRELDGQHVRITYDNGRMVLMSPLPIHEKLKRLLGSLIETTASTLDIPVAMLGSTTWKRRDIAKGLEPDECYYVQNEFRVREQDDFDLTRDPPPDLAIEIDITHSPLDRGSIYAGFGVNEVWRHDGQRIEFLKLNASGKYEPINVSEAFPNITPDLIDRFISLRKTMADTQVLARFRDWLVEHVKR